ncbi:DUF2523 family protein [Actinobacillus equuli subsp. equuli]|uniref:DUF2523 family protein n=1 Tax=Actinobacillus equuli subsp. equuli TaxID=202947 RepID=A0A9X4G863_ACTEU|nr:DUF2523 family protein [Actinobacillus equuli]MDE8035765.1 DUF2523 family protein [Actinobacillus equuli subsp. equuli]
MGAIISFLARSFSGMLSFFFTTVVVKFFVFAIIFIVVSEVVPILFEVFLPKGELKAYFDSIPVEAAFFLSVFKIDVGIKMIFSAYVTRFMIRRIPFIG